jgi:hypothetical protein
MTKQKLSKPDPSAELRERLLTDLRAGTEGVQRWNARPLEERQEAGSFRGADLACCALAGVDLGSLDFEGASFDGATLGGAWLLECNLERASFAGADLAAAWCAGALLREASFARASLAGCNLRGCDCRKASFADANLQGATLAGADLCGADLSSANLRGATLLMARYDEHTRWPPGFRPGEALEWAGRGDAPIDFDLFVKRLKQYAEQGRLGRALAMLKAERFQLYSQVEADSLAGVVKSQTEDGLVYSCRLCADGSFSCCTQELTGCLGQRDGGRHVLCKHLLVLLIGLARGGLVDPDAVERWVEASRGHQPKIDEEAMSEVLLRYKAAEAGEVDWRPTETIPEDYYAL